MSLASGVTVVIDLSKEWNSIKQGLLKALLNDGFGIMMRELDSEAWSGDYKFWSGLRLGFQNFHRKLSELLIYYAVERLCEIRELNVDSQGAQTESMIMAEYDGNRTWTVPILINDDWQLINQY